MVKKAALTLGALALALALALAVGGAALVAPAAHADSSVSIPGAKATFTSADETFRLYDTACDGDSVYVVFKFPGGSESRRGFSGGCNKSIEAVMHIAEGTTFQYKVCVNIVAGPDRCSVWTTDTA